jgi:hypothetical protein
MRTGIWVTILGAIIAAPGFAQTNNSCPRNDALTVAMNRIGEVEHPFDKSKRLPITIADKGKHWHVWWILPEGVAGGTPELLIDKRNCAIFKAYHSQ